MTTTTTPPDTAVDRTDPLAVTAAILDRRTRIKALDESVTLLHTERRNLLFDCIDLGAVLDELLERPREG